MAEPDPTERSDPGGDDSAKVEHHPTAPAFSGTDRRSRRRGRWVLVGAVVAGVSLVSALLAFGLSRDPAVIRSPLLGRGAPKFALRTLNGREIIRLSRFRGQVVVINLWASWCAACRQEHPALLAAWERYRDLGVVLIGVDYQDSTTAATRFMQEMGGDWPTVEDPGGRTALAYGVYGVPETFFIGPDGVVRHKTIGPSSYELLIDQIQRLMPRGG